MAIDDNTTYGLTGAQIKELPGKIEAVKGLAKKLTADDYNWPASNPTSIGAHLLSPGFYYTESGTRLTIGGSNTDGGCAFFVSNESGGMKKEVLFGARNGVLSAFTFTAWDVNANTGSADDMQFINSIEDTLTSSRTDSSLSAKQGKVLKDLVDSLAIRGAGAPTTATVGQVGTLYEDTTNGDLYICTDATNPYVWEAVGGGGGPTVVQTTGTSTTDVMSQNAVTRMVFADPSTRRKISLGGAQINGSDGVAIGINSVCNGNYAIALGPNANANHIGSVALGSYTMSSGVGTVNIGPGQSSYGYNNSNYRLLTGLYDGQSAHDAVTVGQVNSVIDAINTALSTNIQHIGA